MNLTDEDLAALYALESTIVRLSSQQDQMNDYNAGRAYEEAYQYYRARQRGHEPKPSTLAGLDLVAGNAVRETCERLLTTGAPSLKGKPKTDLLPVRVEKLVEYLRELSRSVERHTQQGGRRGYLDFAQTFVR